MKFRKKPVVIEAIQYVDQSSVETMPEEFKASLLIEPSRRSPDATLKFYYIKTLEGNHQVRDGDWIIKGVKGEFYPCKPDIFAMTYEVAE